MPNTWKAARFAPLDLGHSDEPERDARLREFPVLDAGIHNDDGPVMVIDGVGYDEAALLAFAVVDDAHGGWWSHDGGLHAVISVEPGTWMWTPSIKDCEPYGGGWCDSEGEWHRHIVKRTGGTPLTLLGLITWAVGAGAPESYEGWWNRTHPDIPFRR